MSDDRVAEIVPVAGESGRSFAALADEVRKLPERTAQSGKAIRPF